MDPDLRLLRRKAGLLWHQRVRFTTDLVALRRGLHEVGALRIQSGDLFGIFTREKRFGDAVRVVVYPRLVPVKAIVLPRRDLFGAPGVKSPVEDPAYVLGTRDYQPSRPSRHIHWKASARHLRLREKVLEPSRHGRILIALDVGGYQDNQAEDAFERTLEVVASLSVQLEDRGFAVGFGSNATAKGGGSTLIPAARGPRQLPSILEALALLQMARGGSMEQVIRRTSALRGTLSCVFFCHQEGEDTLRAGSVCRHRGMPVTSFVCRPAAGPGASRQRGPAPVHLIDELRVREGGEV